MGIRVPAGMMIAGLGEAVGAVAGEGGGWGFGSCAQQVEAIRSPNSASLRIEMFLPSEVETGNTLQ